MLALALPLLLASAPPAPVAPAPAPTALTAAPPSWRVERFTLANGLVVLLAPDPATDEVAVQLTYGVGSRDERKGRTGFAHLFEHLMFMGSAHVPYPEFDRRMEQAGGQNNADTGADRTRYFESGPARLLETFLWMEADRLATLPRAMTAEKLEAQRRIVRNERRQTAELRPYGREEFVVPAAMYPEGHPYSWPIIGSHEDLEAAQVADVVEFFERYYVASNATLAIAGRFDPAQVRTQVEHWFGLLPARPVPVRATPPLQSRPITPLIELKEDVEAERTVWLWHAPPEGSPEALETEFLLHVLGHGRASRLAAALLLDHQLALEVAAAFEPGRLGSHARLEFEALPGQPLAPALARAEQELQRIQTDGPTPAELARVQRTVRLALARLLESPAGQAELASMLEEQFGDGRALDALLARWSAVTPERLRDRARTLFSSPRMTLRFLPDPKAGPLAGGGAVKRLLLPAALGCAVALGCATAAPAPSRPEPVDGGPTAPADAGPTAAQQLETRLSLAPTLPPHRPVHPPAVKTATLSSGATLWVAELPEAGSETLLVVQRRGASDDGKKAGLTELLVRLLECGGRDSPSARVWLERVAALGTEPYVHAGKLGLQLGLEVNAEDSDTALGLLREAVATPAFRAADLERLRTEALAELETRSDDAERVADDLDRSLFWGRHPFANPAEGTPRGLKQVTLADLRARWRTPASEWALVAVGPRSLESLRAQAETLFAPFPRGPARALRSEATGAVTAGAKQPVHLVDRKGSPQTVVRIAFAAPPVGSPALDAASAAGDVAWGHFTSRLQLRLREREGFTYGVHGHHEALPGSSRLVIASDIRTDATRPALEAIDEELARLAKEGPSAEETDRVRAQLDAELLPMHRGGLVLAQPLAGALLLGEGPDALQLQAERFAALQPEALRQAWQSLLTRPPTIVLVGDSAAISTQLQGSRFQVVPAQVTP